MKFIYNDKEFNVDLSKYITRKKGKSSKLHSATRDILNKLFPLEVIIEEFPLPGLKPKLYADFFLPKKKTIIECQGIQHTQYVPFFHKTRANFIKGKQRDQLKKEWCEINDFNILYINDKDNIEELCQTLAIN